MKTQTEFENELSLEDLIDNFNDNLINDDDTPEIEVWSSKIDEMF